MTAPTPLHQSRRLGDWTIHALQAGGQLLDGGAMFGVVPKPLWERRIPADARNRIPLGMRCLLVEHPSAGPVLIDTGVGNKEDAKFIDIYGIENTVPGHRTMLEAALAAAGFAPEDVRVVINTHLHFDHAGGNTSRDEEGAIVPSFPNARYLVHGREMHYATHTNERTAASYFARNWDVLGERGQLELVEHGVELLPGVQMRHTPGHTPWHQSIVLTSAGETAVFLGDVCPTAAHVPLPWIMGYDVEPLVTLESKRALWQDAAAGSWLVVFEHDAVEAWGRVRVGGKGYEYETGEVRRET
ncbi:MAG TPA: MBL fold metallo-hydrolase [Gemmatimonadaceae bacterium]|nr:MBL fold metallo-hydrolase [Gemmatimonadaceae bacterium]